MVAVPRFASPTLYAFPFVGAVVKLFVVSRRMSTGFGLAQ